MIFFLVSLQYHLKNLFRLIPLGGLKSTSGGSSIFDSAKAAFDHQETKFARACEKLGGVPFGKSDVGLFGGLCGSLNNIFVHMSGQNIGNDMRKDCFRKIMRFSFPQMNYFGSGSLVTRVTNDITQVQNFVSQFVRGMIRTMMLTFGSIFCMWRLNSRFGLIVLCAFPFLVGTLIICLCKANPLFRNYRESWMISMQSCRRIFQVLELLRHVCVKYMRRHVLEKPMTNL